jgi:hypothetical protein
MTTMIIAVIVTLLSTVGYHQRCNDLPAIPPLPSCLLLLEKGGGDSTQTRPDCGRRMALSLLLILFLLLFRLFLLLHCHWAI